MEETEKLLRTVRTNAKTLLKKYLELKPREIFKRDLAEFLEFEQIKLHELRSVYRPKLAGIKFLRARYFYENLAFKRHQEIPPKYFVNNSPQYYFIVHSWESVKNPDPEGRQFSFFKSYVERLKPRVLEQLGFWYDFSCIPQMDQDGLRSEQEEREFTNTLRLMHLLATLSNTVILFTKGMLSRSWCRAEWVLATTISPLAFDEAQFEVPFRNAIKFRHLALVILFLTRDDEMKEQILGGKDEYAVWFINSLLRNMMGSTVTTKSEDKAYLTLLLIRHFWYHVRALGLNNQLATAFLLLNKYGESFVEHLFSEFLVLSTDADLTWTKEGLLDLDNMLHEGPDPFGDVQFHGNRIEVFPGARMEKRFMCPKCGWIADAQGKCWNKDCPYNDRALSAVAP